MYSTRAYSLFISFTAIVRSPLGKRRARGVVPAPFYRAAFPMIDAVASVTGLFILRSFFSNDWAFEGTFAEKRRQRIENLNGKREEFIWWRFRCTVLPGLMLRLSV